MTSPPLADLSRLHVLVPVRGLDDGKARLGQALDAEERETLILGLLVQTLKVLREWPSCEQVHLISGDSQLLETALAGGANFIHQPDTADAGGDLNGALLLGRNAALVEDATAVLCLPADLPLLSTDALDLLLDAADAALAAGNGRPLVVAAPADARDGTNALLLSPIDVIDPAFGEMSLAAHVRAAARADATLQLVVDPRLGFDLDTTDDIERLEPSRLLELLALGAAALPAESVLSSERPAAPDPVAAREPR